MPVLVSGIEFLNSHISKQVGDIVYFHIRTISPEKLRSHKKQDKSRYRSASLTVEAAVALPLFFFSIYIFWQCFLLLFLQISVCRKVAEVALTSSKLGYVERTSEEVKEIAWLYETLIWKEMLLEERADGVFVHFEKAESGRLQGKIYYSFLCETALLPEIRIPVVQCFSFMPYIGEYETNKQEEKEQTEKKVYVTEYGTVYHVSKSCVYLTVEVTAVHTSQVEKQRNLYGKKYSACDVCAEGTATEWVYLSLGGTKYHAKADCTTLKRIFTEKKKEEVTLPACSRCAGGGDGT